MFNTILVAVDGSPASYHAATFGSVLLRPKGGIHLICVQGDRTHRPVPSPFTWSLNGQDRCEIALASAQAAIIGEHLKVRSRKVAQGPAPEAILSRAEEVGADLLCVGSGRRRLKLGSLSSALVKQAPISLAILREGVGTSPRTRILVGIDDSENAALAADRALAIAESTGGAVQLVWVAPPEAQAPKGGIEWDDPEVEPLHGEAAWQAVTRLMERGAPDGVALRGRILSGDPATCLLEEATRIRADLLVLGSGAKPTARDSKASVAAKLTKRAQLPILLVR